jgi:quinol monooxygenase YgiN
MRASPPRRATRIARRTGSASAADFKPEGIAAVKAAIAEFVGYVAKNEPGTRLYASWQQESDPTKFVHLFIFEDEAAHQAYLSAEDHAAMTGDGCQHVA